VLLALAGWAVQALRVPRWTPSTTLRALRVGNRGDCDRHRPVSDWGDRHGYDGIDPHDEKTSVESSAGTETACGTQSQAVRELADRRRLRFIWLSTRSGADAAAPWARL